MKIIGIIGGCGSGKSEISNLLKNKFNAYIINADKVAHDIFKRNNIVTEKVVKSFGKNILDDNGNINRKRLGTIVFSDKEKLKLLTDITHPYINDTIINTIDELKKNNTYNLIVLEITAVNKGEIHSIINEYWYVYCDMDIRLERLLKYRNIPTSSANKIISNQPTDSEFRKYADIVIDNSNTLECTYKQIKKYLH